MSIYTDGATIENGFLSWPLSTPEPGIPLAITTRIRILEPGGHARLEVRNGNLIVFGRVISAWATRLVCPPLSGDGPWRVGIQAIGGGPMRVDVESIEVVPQRPSDPPSWWPNAEELANEVDDRLRNKEWSELTPEEECCSGAGLGATEVLFEYALDQAWRALSIHSQAPDRQA